MSRREALLSAGFVFLVAVLVRTWASAQITFPRPEDTAYYVGVARNLLEGRPAYDNVQVISGARIDPYRPAASSVQQPGQDQPDPARRICSRIDETTIRALPLAPGEAASPTTTMPPTRSAAGP